MNYDHVGLGLRCPGARRRRHHRVAVAAAAYLRAAAAEPTSDLLISTLPWLALIVSGSSCGSCWARSAAR